MKSHVYKRYLLGVLLLITAHNYVDRMALGLLLQDIKVDLDLSDTQLGFLTGISFALFYSLMGIPIARWADRGNRITIITVSTALWSATVAACGFAGTFLQLMLIRIVVAVGEAGCLPPAHSLIADHFTRAERPRAVAIYMLGPPLGLLIAYASAGWLNELYGWRATFLMLGLPGLALAVLAGSTLREPRRGKSKVDRTPAAEISLYVSSQPSLTATFLTLWNTATFRHLLSCLSVIAFFAYGILQWLPAFFIRTFGLQTGEVGTWFALIYGVGGLLGTFWGGALASRYLAQKESLQLKAAAIGYAVFAVLSTIVYLLPNPYLAFGCLALAMVGGCAMNGPVFATIQTVVPDRLRATAIAIVFLFSNLIGMGLGPLAAGVLSDALAPWAGDESLRYALLTLSPGYLWAAWYVWKASRTVQQDLAVSAALETRNTGSIAQCHC